MCLERADQPPRQNSGIMHYEFALLGPAFVLGGGMRTLNATNAPNEMNVEGGLGHAPERFWDEPPPANPDSEAPSDTVLAMRDVGGFWDNPLFPGGRNAGAKVRGRSSTIVGSIQGAVARPTFMASFTTSRTWPTINLPIVGGQVRPLQPKMSH